MIGHCKFCVTLLGGFLLFNDSIAPNQLLGMLSTIGGITIYSYLKLKEQSRQQTLPVLVAQKV